MPVNATNDLDEGTNQMLERLQEELGKHGAFVISRTFDAPRDLMFRVWTECEHLSHWWGPKGATVSSCRNDLRPGGLMHYCLSMPDGEEMWGRWVYREIAEPERIVSINSFSDPEGGLTRHPMAPDWPLQLLTVITFDERDGGTVVTVRWSPYDATDLERATFDSNHDSMRGGWTGTFENLADYLAKK